MATAVGRSALDVEDDTSLTTFLDDSSSSASSQVRYGPVTHGGISLILLANTVMVLYYIIYIHIYIYVYIYITIVYILILYVYIYMNHHTRTILILTRILTKRKYIDGGWIPFSDDEEEEENKSN